MLRYQRLSDFAASYDAFILDLWGVVHDGEALYPDALQALEQLHNRGKKIVFLSNAPRRAWKAEDTLTAFGIPRHWYIAALTSGEMTYEHARVHLSNNATQPCYYYIGPDKDADILSGLPLTMTKNAGQACFAVVTGFNGDDSALEEKLPDMKSCLAANLTLLCANPDHAVVRQSGKRLLCAGIFAEDYARRGGKVHYFGKPYSEIYKKCLSLLGTGDQHPAPIALGDSLHTDILGAKRAGVTSVLVTGGIMQKELGAAYGELPEQEIIAALCDRNHIQPDAVVPCFRW